MNDDILKDVVLSTLAELEDEISFDEVDKKPSIKETPTSKQALNEKDMLIDELYQINSQIDSQQDIKTTTDAKIDSQQDIKIATDAKIDSELEFINSLREEIEILFQGLKSNELVEPEKKRDLVVKYLQNLLFMLSERANQIEKV